MAGESHSKFALGLKSCSGKYVHLGNASTDLQGLSKEINIVFFVLFSSNGGGGEKNANTRMIFFFLSGQPTM